MDAPFCGMIEEVCVLLVDNDEAFLTEMVVLLKSYDYKVTTIGTASAAMAMLSKEQKKIDVMIFNIHSSNLLSFELLAQAVAFDIISLFICDEHNEFLAKKALDKGAYMYLKNSFDEGIIKYLWQFVLREKLQREKVREGSGKNKDQINVEDNEEQYEKRKNVSDTEEWTNNIHEAEDDNILNGKDKLRRKRGRKHLKEINEGESQRSVANKAVKQKAYTEWTEDLHGKFMKVVQQLGEGNCYPKEILEMMNVPNLTRMQVASHLQKCRINNWKAPEERKSIRHTLGQASSSGSQQKSSFKTFGTMPRVQANVLNQQRNSDQVQRGPNFAFPTLSANTIFSTRNSSVQQLYCPQLQVQPYYLSFENPFNNLFFSVQNNIGDGIQQHGPFFGMSHSQGLQDPIIENINYRPSMASNSGGHHTQSDYSLDLNTLPNEQGSEFD